MAEQSTHNRLVDGSSPSGPTIFLDVWGGRLAQLVRVPASHAGGHWFETNTAHGFARHEWKKSLVLPSNIII